MSRVSQPFFVKGPDKVQERFTTLTKGKRVTESGVHFLEQKKRGKKWFNPGQNKKIMSLPESPVNLGWKG